LFPRPASGTSWARGQKGKTVESVTRFNSVMDAAGANMTAQEVEAATEQWYGNDARNRRDHLHGQGLCRQKRTARPNRARQSWCSPAGSGLVAVTATPVFRGPGGSQSRQPFAKHAGRDART
jgi:hypothetical protein